MFDTANPLLRLAVLRDDLKVGNTLANCDIQLARINDPKESFSSPVSPACSLQKILVLSDKYSL